MPNIIKAVVGSEVVESYKQIETKIREFMKEHNMSVMPVAAEITPNLDFQITVTGGYVEWAARLNVKMKDNVEINNVKRNGEKLDNIKQVLLAQKEAMLPKEFSTTETNLAMLKFIMETRENNRARTMRKVETNEEFESEFVNLVEFCTKNKLIPTFEKFAFWTGYALKTLKGIKYDENDDRSEIVNYISDILDEVAMENVERATSPSGSIFNAKARHGFIEADKRLQKKVQIEDTRGQGSYFNAEEFSQFIEIIPDNVLSDDNNDEEYNGDDNL